MKKQQKIAIGVGAGLAAIAAAGAAAALFAGKNAKARRAKVAKWADDAKKEVLKQIKSAKTVSKKTYNSAVDSVITQYKNAKKIDPKELLALGAELKGHWDSIVNEASKATKKVVKKTAVLGKKAVPNKPASNKTTKKAAKKNK